MNNKVINKAAYLSTFGANIFIQGCTVLQAILLARMLGPAGRGEFAVIILWPNLFAGIGILGVDTAIARFVSQGISAGYLMRSALKVTMITGMLTALLCGVLLPKLLPTDKQSLLSISCLYLLSIPLNHLSWSIQSIDHGAANFNWMNFCRIIIYPVYIFGLVLCWYLAVDKIFWTTVALLVGIIASLVIRLIAFRSALHGTNTGPSISRIIKEGLPFSAANILNVFYGQLDKAILVWLLSTEEVGWYVAALAAAGGINIINSSLGTVQFTVSAQGQSGYGFETLARVLRKGAIAAVVGGCVLAVMLPWLIPLVFGSAFKPAVQISLSLLPGVVLAGWSGILTMALKGQGHPIAGVISKGFGLMVMGIVGVELGQMYGGTGVALGYVAGEFIATCGVFFVTLHLYKDVDLKMLQPTWNDMTFIWKILSKRLPRARLG